MAIFWQKTHFSRSQFSPAILCSQKQFHENRSRKQNVKQAIQLYETTTLFIEPSCQSIELFCAREQPRKTQIYDIHHRINNNCVCLVLGVFFFFHLTKKTKWLFRNLFIDYELRQQIESLHFITFYKTVQCLNNFRAQ